MSEDTVIGTISTALGDIEVIDTKDTVYAVDGERFQSEAKARRALERGFLRAVREFALYAVSVEEPPAAIREHVLNIAMAIKQTGIDWAAQSANLPKTEA